MYVNEVNKQPFLSGYAEARSIYNDTFIYVSIVHERGEVVKLYKIILVTESGTIECEIVPKTCIAPITGINISMNFLNIDSNGVLYTGSVGFIFIHITIEENISLFSPNKDYDILMAFDRGLMTTQFSLKIS
ncbi:MAG: hypothetical protein QXE81_02735 [Desulfurococcaceae archaeon]